MAEFCFKCLKEISSENLSEKNFVLSKDLYLCEGCGKYKKVVVKYKRRFRFPKLRYKIFSFFKDSFKGR